MKRPSILSGVLFAFATALLAAPAFWALQGVFPAGFALRAVLLTVHLGYLVWLAGAARHGVGNLTLVAANLLIASILVFLPLAPGWLASLLVLMLALSRSLLFHRSLAAVLLDGLLAVAGLMFASEMLARGGGLIAGLWGFFLVQALFAVLPPGNRAAGPGGSDENLDPFAHSHRQAQAALQRIIGN